MTSPQDATPPSPLFSVWLAPRQTIDRILATQPRHLVLVLAALGTIASLATQILGFGFIDQLLHWRVLLGLIVGGAVLGIGLLYPTAVVFGWVGRLLGGRASTLELRAVLSWSTVPIIAGFAAALAVLVVLQLAGVAATSGPSLGLWVIVTLCGCWSFVIFLLMLSRVQRFGFWRTLTAYGLGLILPFAIAIMVRTLLFQPFDIPSHAMTPTLLDGDHFFVAKYSYGYSHYSLPFSPRLFGGRLFGSEPMRGDVVVFRLPKDDSVDFVKRVIGLPGERIQVKQGRVYINDAPVTRERLADFTGEGLCGPGSATVKRWRETLPNGVSHETLDCVDDGYYDNTDIYTVPAGHFFAMGDNRDNSTDSRVLSAVGYVPFENIIGRITMIYFSSSHDPAEAVARSARAGLMVH